MGQARKFFTAVATVGALAAAAPAAQAQHTATAETNATVTVFRPITLTKNKDLSFGTVVRPLTGSGTIHINKDSGQRSLNGSGYLLATGNPSTQAAPDRATYTVNGEGGQTFSITVPSTFNMTRTGGSETIQVVLTPSATTGQLSNALGQAGTATFGVGGQIVIDSGSAGGAYSGSFTTTVTYN